MIFIDYITPIIEILLNDFSQVTVLHLVNHYHK